VDKTAKLPYITALKTQHRTFLSIHLHAISVLINRAAEDHHSFVSLANALSILREIGVTCVNQNNLNLNPISARHRRTLSRRGVLVGGAIASLTSAVGLSTLSARPSQASMVAMSTNTDDAEVLNNALFYEHQAIWAYQFAAGKLSDSNVGKAVLAVAQANMRDHMMHRDKLTEVVKSLGAMPAMAASTYDLSSYIQRGEGNIDSDVNIAKLALALETDAAIAYGTEVAKLKTPALITAGASIGSTEASHATAIRAAFVALGVSIPVVPASFVSADTREQWVVKV
jgi:rubrerythrin